MKYFVLSGFATQLWKYDFNLPVPKIRIQLTIHFKSVDAVTDLHLLMSHLSPD